MSRKQSTRPIFVIVYFFIVTIVIILALEGLVRLFGLAPSLTNQYNENVEDPYLPFKPRPSSVISGRSDSDEFDFEYVHNTYGFRDVEHSIEKPGNVFRILGLGDSNTYGVGTSFEGSYLYLLEQMLNSRPGEHPKVEIIKAGVPRYFPEPERLMFQHYGVEFDPDLVLVAFATNDLVDTYLGMETVTVSEDGYLRSRDAKNIGELGNWLFIHSHMARLVLSRYIAFKISNEYTFSYDEAFSENGYHEADWQKIETEYARMLALAEEIGAEFALINIPSASLDKFTKAYPGTRLSAWGSENQVTFIDALPAMIEASEGNELYWEIDGHPNSEGYRVIAETVYLQLIEEGLVP